MDLVLNELQTRATCVKVQGEGSYIKKRLLNASGRRWLWGRVIKKGREEQKDWELWDLYVQSWRGLAEMNILLGPMPNMQS